LLGSDPLTEGTPAMTCTTTPTTDLYLTASEAAKIARIHPVTLLRWAREGRAPHRRLSARKIVFPLSKIHEWMASGYTEPVSRAA
jgi:excisionase family DNA binding protein